MPAAGGEAGAAQRMARDGGRGARDEAQAPALRDGAEGCGCRCSRGEAQHARHGGSLRRGKGEDDGEEGHSRTTELRIR